MKRRSFFTGLFVPLVGIVMLVSACAGTTVSAQDIQGVLQAMQGKEMVITLDDGTVVKIQVDNSKTGDDAQKLIGKEVTVKAKSADSTGTRKATSVENRGKDADQVTTDTVSAATTTSFTVGGKTFKVDANTRLDDGLAKGVKVRVDSITLKDGTELAREIEADDDGFRFSGKVEKKDDTSITVSGKTFKLNPASRLDDGIKTGDTVKLKFDPQSDKSVLADRVTVDKSGADLNKMRFSGKVEAKDAAHITVNGEDFKVDASTKVDDNVKSGGKAKVEFETQPDGSMLAKNVLPDNGSATEDTTTGGAIVNLAAGTITVGSDTFKIGPATRMDNGLKAGANVKVESITLSDGTKMATAVESATDDSKVSGALAMTGNTVTVGGKTFAINAATKLEPGLIAGAAARVEFITLADGTLVATHVEAAPRESELRGREAETGDVRGGGEAQSGDNRGGGGATPQPGDDKIKGTPVPGATSTPTPTSGEAQPGDIRGGGTTPEPGDVRGSGADAGGSGGGGGTSGGGGGGGGGRK